MSKWFFIKHLSRQLVYISKCYELLACWLPLFYGNLPFFIGHLFCTAQICHEFAFSRVKLASQTNVTCEIVTFYIEKIAHIASLSTLEHFPSFRTSEHFASFEKEWFISCVGCFFSYFVRFFRHYKIGSMSQAISEHPIVQSRRKLRLLALYDMKTNERCKYCGVAGAWYRKNHRFKSHFKLKVTHVFVCWKCMNIAFALCISKTDAGGSNRIYYSTISLENKRKKR